MPSITRTCREHERHQEGRDTRLHKSAFLFSALSRGRYQSQTWRTVLDRLQFNNSQIFDTGAMQHSGGFKRVW